MDKKHRKVVVTLVRDKFIYEFYQGEVFESYEHESGTVSEKWINDWLRHCKLPRD